MKVTRIEPRRKSLYEIYLDDLPAGEVDRETVHALHIRVGSELSDEGWRELCEQSEITRAKSYALYLLSHRSYTGKGLKDKVKERHGAAAAEQALARMEELGLVNDEDYARRYAGDLYRLRGFSQSRVCQELVRKGIERELAREVAQSVAEQAAPDPEEAVFQLLNTKFSRSLSDEKGKKRAVAALQRLGYRWSEIRGALARLEDGTAFGDSDDAGEWF